MEKEKAKLETLENLVEKNMEDLPLVFRHLHINQISDANTQKVKVVDMPPYRSRENFVFGSHKPISKMFDYDNRSFTSREIL